MKTLPVASEADWHAIRAKHVGSSEVAALFHVQPEYALSMFALWQVKAGRAAAPEVNSKRPKWGKRLEAVIAEAAAEEHGWTIEPGPYVEHGTIPGMGASIDFIITGGPEVKEKGMGILECKNVDWLIHKRQWTDGEPPMPIILQLQHQLGCTDYRWGAVVGLVGGNDLVKYEYEAKLTTVSLIEQRVIDFWKSIEEGREPAVDNRSSTADMLQQIYGTSTAGKSYDCSMDKEFPERIAQLKQARLDMAALKAQATAAENWILHRIKDAEVVMDGDTDVILTAKTTKRKGYAVEPCSFRAIKLRELDT